MLDHDRPYTEKIHYIDAELAEHVHKLDVKLQNLCGSSFSLFVVRILAKALSLWQIDQQHLAKTKIGHILLPSN